MNKGFKPNAKPCAIFNSHLCFFPAGQTGGVLVLKNQDHLSQTTKTVTIQTPKSQSSWQQRQQQSVSSWQPQTKQQQHQSQMIEKTGWSNSPVSFFHNFCYNVNNKKSSFLLLLLKKKRYYYFYSDSVF